MTAGMAASVLALGAGAAVVATVNVPRVVDRLTSSSPYLRDSIGRHEESTGSRTELAREGVRLWLNSDRLLGLGPVGTQSTLRARQAPYVKEAHNDYLAALNERGVLGGTAMILLIAAIAVASRRISRTAGPPPPWRPVVPRPELLAATVVAIALSAMFYEVLHFRHVWAFFGLIAALELARRRPTEPSP
jgi:O-antigen ligase